MGYIELLKESGWGAVFTFIYALLIIWHQFPDLHTEIQVIFSIALSLFLVFLSIVFNDELMELFAGDVVRESLREIKEKVGDEEEFYWDADEEAQLGIDDLDKKTHRHKVTILAGGIMGSTLPFILWYEFGLIFGGLGVLGALVIFYIFCLRSYNQMHEIIKSSPKQYASNNED